MIEKINHLATANLKPDHELVKAYSILTPLQRDVAIGHLRGLNNRDAYNSSLWGTATNPTTQKDIGQKTLQHPMVKKFIILAQAQTLTDLIMTRDEAQLKLSQLARINLADIIEVQKVPIGFDKEGEEVFVTRHVISDKAIANPEMLKGLTEITPTANGIKFKAHDQKAAIKQLADMNGWDKPKQVEVSGAGNVSELSDGEFADELAGLGIDGLS